MKELNPRKSGSKFPAPIYRDTCFPIDRYYTASLLGFEGLQINSYGAIAAVDYLTESCSTLAVCMLNLGRLAQDFLQCSSAEFEYIRLSDGYVQISSIMPQKRNPVPLEHVRVLSGKAMTQAQAIFGSLHNTPFTDINDSEDDLQPMVYNAFEDAQRSLKLLAGVLEEMEFATDRMAAAADANFLTVTELADTLVRETGMSFRTAHEIVSKAVKDLDGVYVADRMTSFVERIMAAEASRVHCAREVAAENLSGCRAFCCGVEGARRSGTGSVGAGDSKFASVAGCRCAMAQAADGWI